MEIWAARQAVPLWVYGVALPPRSKRPSRVVRQGAFMHEEMWVGVQLKLQHAEFHLRQMARSLEPPEPNAINVALPVTGPITDSGWQRSFYAHLDAFLSAARSVPEIIQCCFGEDRAHMMQNWFHNLSATERDRRHEFAKQFEMSYADFRALPLGAARHIGEHRTGLAPVKVTISGQFGVTDIGSPAKRLPVSETRHTDDPNLAFVEEPIPFQPRWDDFDIQGKPLFPACQSYLNRARALMDEAGCLSLQVHHNETLSSPPTH
jgi:hypothetical protein